MQTEQDDNASVDDKPKARTGKPLGLRRHQNNNHHVVPLGILVVLATIYLMIAGLQINYKYYFRTGVDAVEISQKDDDSHENTIPLPSEIDVAQHQPLCRKVEIFTRKVMNGLSDISKNKPKSNKTGLALGSGIRQSKTGKNDKKKDSSKKPNTAEPIIYLFALVFIYLLLKAASDINQHYKTQNKGDKRLRRCSLQSYAQKDQRSSHQDRRASKGVQSMFSRHHIFAEGRTVSLDRFKYTISREEKTMAPKKMLINMQKQSSFGEYARASPAPVRRLTGEALFDPRMSRRLSVPITINYQTVNIASALPELARRGSVINNADTNILGMSALPLASQPIDTKRRVRMINRH